MKFKVKNIEWKDDGPFASKVYDFPMLLEYSMQGIYSLIKDRIECTTGCEVEYFDIEEVF